MKSQTKQLRTDHARERIVLDIRSFLALDGSDGETADITSLSKWKQLARYLARPQSKWVQENGTMEELALGFYPKDTADTKRYMEPRWRAMEKMKAVCTYLRKKAVKQGAEANYSVKVFLDDINKDKFVMINLKTWEQFTKIKEQVEKVADGAAIRVEELKELRKLTPAQRKKQMKELLAEQ
jgi:hypothetical protein